MTRYTLTDPLTACPATRAVYDDYLQCTGDTTVPIWLQSLGHSPALARAYWERAKGTLLCGTLPLPLKEMIVFAVSALNGARYCSACHAQAVLRLDETMSHDMLRAFVEGRFEVDLPPIYRAAVVFAAKVVADPNAIEDSDFEPLRTEGFSATEICEILAVIDMTAMFNIYTSTLQLDLDPSYRAVL